MQEISIILKDIQSVRDFVQQVILLDYEVDLMQGRYIVDAKSIMGIFALDILSPITVQAHTKDASAFFERIKGYIVE
ncbi:MAG: HPr family phosphocarrier protein [Clostridia bacterium]|nr:HPr family phosphocarrier protein [Clostridia bacterium]